MSQTSIIRVQGLAKAYLEGSKRQAVLAGVTMEVQPGECVALLGRSGSGKSTLLNLLAGIDHPDAGELHIAGQPLHRLSEQARTLFRRQHIGFVYQFFNLIPTLTVVENVRLPLELNTWPEARIRERVAYLLQEVGLQERGDSFPDRLSGGEQQRVAIARALAQAPQLVLADEPTGNLDANTGRHMLELLLDLRHRAGNTLLLVTHNREVARRADRTLLLEDGILRENGERLAW